MLYISIENLFENAAYVRRDAAKDKKKSFEIVVDFFFENRLSRSGTYKKFLQMAWHTPLIFELNMKNSITRRIRNSLAHITHFQT